MFLIVTIISIILWNKVGQKVLDYTILNGLIIHNQNRKVQYQQNEENILTTITKYRSLIYFLLGIDFSTKKQFYLEPILIDTDLNNLKKILRRRLVDVVSACTGISILIGIALRFQFSNLEPGGLLWLSLIIINVSPILVCWFIPVIWTIEDSRIKAVDHNNHVYDLATELRKGFLNRFLGYSGVFAGLAFLIDVLPELEEGGFVEATSSQLYIGAMFVLVIILLLISGTVFFITVYYLNKYHKFKVINLRKELSNFIPFGITLVRKTTNEEQSILTTPPSYNMLEEQS